MDIQQRRLIKVLQRMIKMAEECEFDAEMFSGALNPVLDDLASNDSFGSEMQCDPRGDGRNGEFTMWNVEGV